MLRGLRLYYAVRWYWERGFNLNDTAYSLKVPASKIKKFFPKAGRPRNK